MPESSSEHANSAEALRLPVSPHQPGPYQGPSKEEVLSLRRRFLSPAMLLYYREPLMIVEGKMQYVWDETGRQYLDAFAGIVTVSVGHCHPHVARAMQEQAGKLMHTTVIYLHPTIARYAEKLAKTYPEDSGLEVSYFTNSGSESNDLAVMMARLSTDRFDVISLRNGYHGGTHATMGFTAQSNWKMPLPVNMGVHYALPGYCYRCPLGLTYPACDVKCARDIGEVIRYQTSGQVACFISEIVQGVGGTVTPPKEYFQIAYEEVRKAGGLCIADEVQTGFGRTGEHFWGFENYNVHPDLVTTAKGIGNGAALGAVTTRADVAEPLAQKLHFNTFGGNPVSMAAGLATLEVIEGEKIQQNAKVVGAHLKARLRELQDKYPIIGEVRGMGLMLGVELVRDRGTKEPADTETAEVVELARERGLLIGKGSVFKNVLRIKPPMCITTDDANFIGDCLDEVFSRIEQHD